MRFSGSLAWPVWWMKNGISIQCSFMFIYYGWSWKLFCMFSGHFISLTCLFMCFALALKSTWLSRLQLLLFHCFYLPGKSLPKPLFKYSFFNCIWSERLIYSTELSFYYVSQIENLLIDKFGPFSFMIWLLCSQFFHVSSNYWVYYIYSLCEGRTQCGKGWFRKLFIFILGITVVFIFFPVFLSPFSLTFCYQSFVNNILCLPPH